MDLAFSPEQEELANAVKEFAASEITPERLRGWEGEADGCDAEFWTQVGELGWLGLGLPAAAGGSGLGLVDVACFFTACSRSLIPPAVLDHVRAATALAHLDPAAPELSDFASGRQRIALALDGNSSEPLRIEGSGLSGAAAYVPQAAHADWLLAHVADGSGGAWALVRRAAGETTGLRGFASHERQTNIRFARAPLHRTLCNGAAAATAVEQIRRRQIALALAEMIGGMDAVLEMSVAYVKQREQFGQKIAVFQAVQHQVADMATAYTAGRHLAWQAITRIANDGDEAIDLPAAAAFVGQAYKRLTLTAHHLHGGAGFVVEHPLHYYSERAQALCIRYTPEAAALERVAATLLD